MTNFNRVITLTFFELSNRMSDAIHKWCVSISDLPQRRIPDFDKRGLAKKVKNTYQKKYS